MARPWPELADNLVKRVLLRLPPTDPAGLLRAALACKQWAHLMANLRFRRRYRDFHGGDAMLGVLCNLKEDTGEYVSRFVPTSSSSCPRRDLRWWRALDARHGRVLLRSLVWKTYLDVWDPVTGKRWELTATPPVERIWNAAVVCAAHRTCNHLNCRGGPFFVVVVGAGDPRSMSFCFYSSESARWSKPQRISRLPEHGVDVVPPALIGNALHFGIDLSRSILKYDLVTGTTVLIHQPPGSFRRFSVIMATEDQRLGVARLVGSRLFLSSLLAGPRGETAWSPDRVIDLNGVLPADALPVSSDFVGYAQGFDVFFVETKDGLYSYQLNSGRVKKVCDDKGIHNVVPYLTLYIPALRAEGIGSSNA